MHSFVFVLAVSVSVFCGLVKMGQMLGCVQVDQATVTIKENFGKYDDVLQPGCHCVPWCFGSRVGGSLSLRVRQLDVRCETKTKVYYTMTSP